MGLALMLLGAFLATNRGHLALARLDDDRRVCKEAVLALADYCRFRFEKDRGWGRVPEAGQYSLEDDLDRRVFSFTEIASDRLDDYPELTALPGGTHVIGEMPSNGVTFHLAITNNFRGDAAVDGVAPKHCRLRIEARRAAATETVEVGYRTAAFVDSTLAASERIKIDIGNDPAERLVLNSKDPVHNELRSLSSVEIPTAESIAFRQGQADVSGVRGTVWARRKIAVGGQQSQEALDRAALATQGQFISNGRSHYSVPELTLAQAQSLGESLDKQSIRCGVYYFNRNQVTYSLGGVTRSGTIATFQRFRPLPNGGQGELTDFDFLATDLPAGADLNSVRLTNHPDASSRSHPSDDFQVDNGLRVSFYRDGGFKPKATLETDKKLVVKPEELPDGRTLPGDLKIKAADDYVPEISLGATGGEGEKVCLNVERDLVLEGKISGGGKLIAGRDVTLQANTVDVRATVLEDVAIYAGEDVRIYPAANRGTDGDNDGEGAFIFRGLVYASNDFSFSSEYIKTHNDGSEERFRYNRDLVIEGAMVARHGSATIDSNRSVKLIYNPEYLDDFLENEIFGDRLQVEEMVWRPL